MAETTAENADDQAAAAAAEAAAAEKAKEPKPAAAKPAEEKQEPKGYVVTGAAVVLPTESGSERYLYKGATVGAGFTKNGIKHALAVGLIAKAK